jgi:hypothetical protein
MEKLTMDYFGNSWMDYVSWVVRNGFYLIGILYLVASYFRFFDVGQLSIQMIQEIRNLTRGDARPRESLSMYLRNNLGIQRYNY